jgi:predicted HicB family RNase H-like nuclease
MPVPKAPPADVVTSTFRLPREQHAQLRAEAQARAKSMSQLVSEALALLLSR